MLNFKTPLYFWQSKNRKKKRKSFPRESCFTYTPVKLYNFSMLINMSIVVLQVPDTFYLLATCTFSEYSTVESVVVSWKLWNMCSHGSLGESLISCFISNSSSFLGFFFSKLQWWETESVWILRLCHVVRNILDVTCLNDLLFVLR